MTRRALLLAVATVATAGAADYESPPINYTGATPDNAVSRLQAKLAGGTTLPFRGPAGRLPALLEALDVPASSQVLGFAHTSLQRDKIGPVNPRAIFFNDDIAVGYVPGGVLEIAAVDAALGTVFYVVENAADADPAPARETNRCLTCHGAQRTRNVPGWQVRSVFADAGGEPIVKLGSHQVTQATDLSKRWGGWFVTGRTGPLPHLGNLAPTPETPAVAASGTNLADLRGRPGIDRQLSPHSDLVALLTLEHQAEAINLLVAAGFETRIAEHLAKTGADAKAASKAAARAAKACAAAADYLCFAKEAAFPAPMSGSTTFAAEFAARPPRHSSGRSLREFDLSTRLFKHGVSYMIHSTAFRALPPAARSAVQARIDENLAGRGAGNLPKLDPAAAAATKQLLAAAFAPR